MNISRFINISSIVRGKVSCLECNCYVALSKICFKVLYHLNNGLRTCSSVEKYIVKQNVITHLDPRYVSTCEVKGIQKEESLIKKALYKMPFLNLHKLVSVKY